MYNPIAPNVMFETAKPAQVLTQEASITVPVRVIRGDKHGSYTANYSVEASEDGIFTDDCNGTVTFADGEAVKIINVTANNMVKGTKYTYTMTMDDAVKVDADTILNNGVYETVVSIMCDYNWLAAGTCDIFDGTWYEGGASAEDVPIQNAEGTNIYRIVSPLAAIYTGLESNPDESNFQFVLNDDKSITVADGIYMNWWGYQMYYDGTNYPTYCNVVQDDTTYALNFLLLNGTSLYTGGYFEFTWNDRP